MRHALGRILGRATHTSPRADVGLTKITPCFENGKSTVLRDLTGGIGSGTRGLHVIRPLLVAADYIILFLKSSHFINTGIARKAGTAEQKRVPREHLTSLPFPHPCLAGQHRIAAKADEPVALCDRLEAGGDVTGGILARLLVSLLQATLTPSAFEAATAGAVGE